MQCTPSPKFNQCIVLTKWLLTIFCCRCVMWTRIWFSYFCCNTMKLDFFYAQLLYFTLHWFFFVSWNFFHFFFPWEFFWVSIKNRAFLWLFYDWMHWHLAIPCIWRCSMQPLTFFILLSIIKLLLSVLIIIKIE